MPRKRRFRGKRRGKGQYVEEQFTFSVQLGNSQSITKGNLSSLPPSHNFRVQFIRCEAVAAYIPSSTGFTGSYAPSALNVQITEATDSVSSSRTVVLGHQPKRVSVRAKTPQDWYSHARPDTSQLGIIEAVCLGNPGVVAYVRGVCTIGLALQPENLTPTCPTSHLSDTDPTGLSDGFLRVAC